MQKVPDIRVSVAVDKPVRPAGEYVLYWMVANRRASWNFSLDHAAYWAHKLSKPLLVFEPLRAGYQWASHRIHRFVMQGMRDNAEQFAKAGIGYYPYVEPKVDADKGLLKELADRACLVVSDDYPCFFLPRMLDAQRHRLSTRLELVDSNGLLPLRAAEKTYPTAYAFRRFLQKELPNHLLSHPVEAPLRSAASMAGARVPAEILRRWPAASPELLRADSDGLRALPIDATVGPACIDGGQRVADALMHKFLMKRLPNYGADRNHPDREGASGMSPYLHFGHLSVHAVFHRLAAQEKWELTALAEKTSGSREGWWGMSAAAEAFLDEVITWREVGYNMSAHNPTGYDQYESLPDWAQKTLAEHAHDPRPYLVTAEQFENAQTEDKVWNAAQRQLRRDGSLHNYLRMLWGKKILEWSKTPQDALATMIHLNNKYGVDGRDPNSYSGIFWTLGRFDRPWPERTIFGKIRYMSSASTLKKLQMSDYLQRYSSGPSKDA